MKKWPADQMVAQVVTEYGGPDVFKTKKIPAPTIKPGHVIIEIKASSINPVDYKIRQGLSPWLAPDLPAVLHSDLAGVVVEVGKNVTHFKAGDEVYGCAGGFKGNSGALAEYMLADVRLLAHKPRSLSMIESAALPLVAITAYEALVKRAQLKTGQTILIQGAAGGVGHIAVQLAKHLGAKVYATVSSPDKFKLVESYGAIGIDYRENTVKDYVQVHTNDKGFDVVMNTVGGQSLTDALVACGNNGVVVGISSSAMYDLSPMHKKGLSLHLVFMPNPLITGIGREQYGEILEKIATLADEGQIRPYIDRVFPFSEVGAAHLHLESKPTLGKIALEQDLAASFN
jgi:NADPH2:quinone reductase